MIPESGEGFKSGFVALVGRPNVGKSTLLNALIGQKIAITSPVAQTTRNRLRGILTLPAAQIVLVDTPGIHKPHHLLGQTIVRNAIGAISSVDITVLLVDGSDRMGTGDRFVAETILQSKVPTILGINKIDLVADESSDTFNDYEGFAEEHGWQVAKFSSTTGEGLESLQTMMCDRLPLGPYYYPPDLVTDQPERFIMGELIREQILLLTREEIPHSVAISIDQVDEQPKITRVMATIHVERDSQKGILIGKKGQMLKEIGTQARLQMQKMIMGSVHLEMFVKVQPKWRSSRFQLADLGYRVE
jgi:GTP-binding protein Era